MIFRHIFYAVLLGVFLVTAGAAAANDGSVTTITATSVSPGGAIENVKEGGGGKLSWNGRSKKMFDNVVKAAPFFVRSKVESRMINEIKKRKLSVVTESDLYKVVRAVTPKLFLSNSLTAMGKA